MSTRLDGKVVIITGAARGQGAAAAKRLVREGAIVILTDIRHEEGQTAAAHLGASAAYMKLDVTSANDWDRVVSCVLREHGRIDVLVNNAGILRVGALAQTTEDQFREVMDANLIGTFNGMRAVLPTMLSAQQGSIINVSSVNGLVGTPGLCSYTAAKHAILGLTRAAAMELAPKGVRVNAICPGGVDTPMASEALQGSGLDFSAAISPKIPLGRLAHDDEMSGMIAFLASDDSGYCIGGAFVVDGGLTLGFQLE